MNHVSHTGKAPLTIRKYKIATAKVTGCMAKLQNHDPHHTHLGNPSTLEQKPHLQTLTRHKESNILMLFITPQLKTVAIRQSKFREAQNTNLFWIFPGVSGVQFKSWLQNPSWH